MERSPLKNETPSLREIFDDLDDEQLIKYVTDMTVFTELNVYQQLAIYNELVKRGIIQEEMEEN